MLEYLFLCFPVFNRAFQLPSRPRAGGLPKAHLFSFHMKKMLLYSFVCLFIDPAVRGISFWNQPRVTNHEHDDKQFKLSISRAALNIFAKRRFCSLIRGNPLWTPCYELGKMTGYFPERRSFYDVIQRDRTRSEN